MNNTRIMVLCIPVYILPLLYALSLLSSFRYYSLSSVKENQTEEKKKVKKIGKGTKQSEAKKGKKKGATK